MNKSSYFFGQWVFGQLISLIQSNLVKRVVRKHNSDYYTKTFTTADQMVRLPKTKTFNKIKITAINVSDLATCRMQNL